MHKSPPRSEACFLEGNGLTDEARSTPGGPLLRSGVRLVLLVLLVLLASSSASRGQTNALSVAAPTADPSRAAETPEQTEKEYRKILADDDTAQAEVDRWIKDNEKFAAQGGGVSREELRVRIEGRFSPVRKAYLDFLQRHPDHARARLAYGSFLNDLEDEEGAMAQWEKARELDPKNPAAWNNLANLYAHRGPVAKAFEYFGQAIALNPRESLYYHSLGTCIYLFRRDATNFYHLSDQQVFDKALGLYAEAQKLDPDNFPLATDIAQTYYGIEPMRTDAALKAWNYALKLAGDEIEREGVYVHLARIQIKAGRFDEARRQLDAVTNAMYAELKQRLARNLAEKQAQATTNAPVAARP